MCTVYLQNKETHRAIQIDDDFWSQTNQHRHKKLTFKGLSLIKILAYSTTPYIGNTFKLQCLIQKSVFWKYTVHFANRRWVRNVREKSTFIHILNIIINSYSHKNKLLWLRGI